MIKKIKNYFLKKKNFEKFFYLVIVIYFTSGLIGISGIIFLHKYLKEKHSLQIKNIMHNLENRDLNSKKRIFSLEYFLFPKKK